MAEAAQTSGAPPPPPQEPRETVAAVGRESTPAAPIDKRPAEAIGGDVGKGDPLAKKAKRDDSVEPQKGKDDSAPEDLKNLNARQYLEKTVVPLLMQGLQQLVKERPNDPYTALSEYLRDNNPKKA